MLVLRFAEALAKSAACAVSCGLVELETAAWAKTDAAIIGIEAVTRKNFATVFKVK